MNGIQNDLALVFDENFGHAVSLNSDTFSLDTPKSAESVWI